MRTRRVRIALVAVATSCATAVMGIWFSGPIGAASTTAPVSGGSWFWLEQTPRSVDNPVIPAGAQLPAPEVPSGDFAVAVKAPASGVSQPGVQQDVGDDKQTFLHIDTTSLLTGSTVEKFVLTIAEDSRPANPGAQQGPVQSQNPTAAKIGAFVVTGFFSDGTSAGPWSDRPAFDRNGLVAQGTRAANGTWTFDLTAIVSAWVSGAKANNGIALVATNVDQQTEPWEIIWKGSSPPPTTAGTFTPPPPEADSTDSTETFDTTPASSSPSFTFSAPVSITPDLSAPITVPTPVPPAVPGVALRPTRAAASHPQRGITVGFVLTALAVLALAAAAMVALGELGEPVPIRRGSVLRALERRAHGTA